MQTVIRSSNLPKTSCLSFLMSPDEHLEGILLAKLLRGSVVSQEDVPTLSKQMFVEITNHSIRGYVTRGNFYCNLQCNFRPRAMLCKIYHKKTKQYANRLIFQEFFNNIFVIHLAHLEFQSAFDIGEMFLSSENLKKNLANLMHDPDRFPWKRSEMGKYQTGNQSIKARLLS